MPKRVLDAYFKYIDNLQIKYQVGKTIGKGHADRCSIPQGCPFSMTIIGLVMVPWVNLMKDLKVDPRVLADDLMFSTSGKGHLLRTIDAMNASRDYFHDMGAKVADKKCFTFATSPHTRNHLVNHIWNKEGLKIPNINSFRDLGTHVNLTKASNGATLTQRMLKAIVMCKRLQWMRVSREQKEQIVRANILPAALYGAEGCFVNRTVLNSLRVGIARCIGPRSKRRCVDLTFAFSGAAKDLDPEIHIIFGRIAALRRNAANIGPKRESLFKLILKKYQNLADRMPQKTNNLDPFLNWKKSLNKPEDLEESKRFQPKGPVGFLIGDLMRWNIQFDSAFNIYDTNEVPIDVWNMPWQHLKKAVFDLLTRTRDGKVDDYRTFAGQFNELDYDIIKKVKGQLGCKEQKVYMHIATGGFWGEDHIQEAYSTSGCCPHCGCKDVSTKHILWECPVIKQSRSFNDLSEINHEHLPQPIANGLPLAMSATFDKTYWGEDSGQGDEAMKTVLGMPETRRDKDIAESNNYLLNELLVRSDSATINNVNARQAFGFLRNLNGETSSSLPFKCHALAPSEINVFTDGSWVNPKKWFLGMGGAGVFWPGRVLSRSGCNQTLTRVHLLNKGEEEVAFHKQELDGVRLWTKVSAYNGNSTRAELTAGLMALMAEGPVHIGSDSRAFVDRANAIINRIHKHKPFKKPWGVVSDGDLWEFFVKAVKQKGTKSIRISWVKGHATEANIKQGTSDPIKKYGNDTADTTANEGAELHGQDLLKLSGVANKRHGHYLHFMVKVVKHIVESYIIHRKLVDFKEEEEAALREGDAKGIPFCPLGYVDVSKARELKPNSSMACHRKHASIHATKELEAFYSTLLISPDGDAKGRMITWLELYILYRVRGGCKPIPDNPRVAVSRATADKQIAAFKRKSRGVLEKTLDESDINLIKPSKSMPNELKGCGILGKLPTLKFNVYINDVEARTMAITLSKLIRTASFKKHEDFIDGVINLIPHKFKLKGKAGWDSTIPTVSDCNLEETSWAKAFKCGAIPPIEVAEYLFCPRDKCKKVESSHRGIFQRIDLDHKFKCGFCSYTAAIKSWKCECSKPWHSCHKHRGCYLQMPKDLPITAQLKLGRPTWPDATCKRPSTKRTLITGEKLRRRAKRIRVEDLRGEKRKFKTITLEDYVQPLLKGYRTLGHSSGNGLSGGSCSRYPA